MSLVSYLFCLSTSELQKLNPIQIIKHHITIGTLSGQIHLIFISVKKLYTNKALKLRINIALSPETLLFSFDLRSHLISKMKDGPYSIYTDGSNDNGLEKMMPLCVRTYDEKGMVTEFLDMCMGRSSSAQGIAAIPIYLC